MAELIVEPIQTAELESSGYVGQPEGNIDLTENNVQVNVAPYKYATPKIPIQEDVPAVNPSTQEQTIVPAEGFAGMDRVIVNPANLESKRVTPTTEEQTVVPQSPAIGFSQFTVEPVTSSIDPDIQPENIKQGIDILGVQGTLKPPTLITKQITANGTYSAEDDNADGYSEVEVNVPDESKVVLDSLIDRSITTITSDVTTIGSGAFQDCRALTEVNFPKATSISGQAFYNCTSLSEVNFLKVRFIGSNAFYNCRALKYFDMSEVDNVPTIYANTFNGSTFIFLFRDQMQLDEYASATNWAALADRFQIKGATS